MKKVLWIILGVSAILIGFYPLTYFVLDREFGLLASKSPELLSSTFWNIAFYGHIILGGLALLIGWLQFNERLRNKRLKLHRTIGQIYITAVLISGFCSLYIAFFATAGLISGLGFFSLGVIWLGTTITALSAIKKGDIALHEKMMIYSYAACFAAVTLRIWLPILIISIGDFVPAYRIVAWLSWVPNIIVAFFIVRRKRDLKIE